MPSDPDLRTYTIVGTEVSGDGSAEEASSFSADVQFLDKHAEAIGRILGMTSLNACAVSMEEGGLAFRHATSSADNFDVKGIVSSSFLRPHELLTRL